MELSDRIYLDYAATTPVDKRVITAMLPYLDSHFGNASSLHFYGTSARDAMEKSRKYLAESIGASPHELVFTSGGTESNNLAIKGIALANRSKGNHIMVSSIEHDCILNTCRWLETQGFFISYIPVDRDGIVDLHFIQQTINSKTILVSVMTANNEIGTIQPVEAIGAICNERGVYFHSDASQSYGKIPIDVDRANIDLLTINSHKIYGPKGIGALYVRKGTPLVPVLHGGGQELGFRSTTENIAGIIGFEKAASISMIEMIDESQRQIALREKFIDWLLSHYENAYINGHREKRLPGNINFAFHGFEGETIRLLFMLDELGIAVSAGSACSSNHGGGASHVLQAIGLDPFQARGAIRISLGRYTSEEHIEILCNALKNTVMQMNSIYS